MNCFIGSGRLTRSAVVQGNEDNKALKFTIASKYGYDKENNKDRVAFVPCVIFRPTDNLVNLLTENGKGMFVELQGRVSTSRFEVNGEVKYSTEVIVNKRNFNIVNT